jgi:hypothetical protein
MPRALLALFLTALAPSSHAVEVNAWSVYQTLGGTAESEKLPTLVFLQGVSSGLSAANAFLKVSGQTPMFCAPDGLNVDMQFIVETYAAAYENKLTLLGESIMKEIPPSIVLRDGYRSKFACPP